MAENGCSIAHWYRAGLFSLTLCALGASCAAGEDQRESEILPPGTPIEIDAAPQRTVGVLEGDTVQEFDRVTTPFLMPDGRLVVPVAGANAIRVFGPGGEFAVSLGRPGEGPGEFASLGEAWPRGDTIEAFDSRLRRITRFFPDGTKEVVSLESTSRAQAAVPGALPDGWATSAVAAAGVGRRDEMVVHRFGSEGAHRNEIARIEGMFRYSTSAGTGPGPLSPGAVFAVSGGEVYVAETLTPGIQVFEPSGEFRREITWEPETSVSAEAAFGAVVDAAVMRAGAAEAEAVRQRLEAFPVPDRISSLWDFIVDEEGFVWVRPFEAGKHAVVLGGARAGGAGAGGEWLVFSPDGLEVGTVTVPDGIEPTQITGDAVVGIGRDALGVESVRVHVLRRH